MNEQRRRRQDDLQYRYHVEDLRQIYLGSLRDAPRKEYKPVIKYLAADINSVVRKINTMLSDLQDEKTRLDEIPANVDNPNIRRIAYNNVKKLLNLTESRAGKEIKYRTVYATFLLSRYVAYYMKSDSYIATTNEKAEDLYRTEGVDYRDLITYASDYIPTYEECLGILPV